MFFWLEFYALEHPISLLLTSHHLPWLINEGSPHLFSHTEQSLGLFGYQSNLPRRSLTGFHQSQRNATHVNKAAYGLQTTKALENPIPLVLIHSVVQGEQRRSRHLLLARHQQPNQCYFATVLTLQSAVLDVRY